MSLFNRQPKETLLLAEERRIAGRHVSLRPTKLCISMTLLSVAIWVGAVNYQVNVAYAICFWVLAFIGVAALMTRRQLLGLHLNARYEGEVFAGDTADDWLLAAVSRPATERAGVLTVNIPFRPPV